ncbi:spermidine synthase-like protein [Leptothrix cholodnii SP-6]|uniref:Spermidine synthase-like protein n=1 Tax=Leptothrix cholodnii (strain ATCC 51168 / LMG 8142 / SP-6) TaxID=395495 RepID=B1Y454_LEPCP|nr:spermidine synthase-like protein [Leptothrix cholodnii]ACB34576.1 spermidine synthase-like protein [Leptothrix cholodnii SP-6]
MTLLNNIDGEPGLLAQRSPARKKREAGTRKLPVATISEFEGVRYLHLGQTPWVQGAMRLRKTRVIELEYVRRMMVWLLLHEPDRWADLHAVQLGLGAAALTRFCHTELKMCTTAVELNPQVIAACRQWFRLPPDSDPRLRVIEADAGAWVAEPEQAGTADVLNIDLYDHQAAAPVLDDDAFYAACHTLLADDGVLTVNLFGRNASFGRSARRIQAAFVPTGGQVWMLDPTDEHNTIVVALKGRGLPPAEVLAQRAGVIEARTGLKAREWLPMLKPVPVARASRARTAAASATPDAPAEVSTDPATVA